MATAIQIIQEKTDNKPVTYRAFYGTAEATGMTIGQALDALTNSINDQEAHTVILIQRFLPDRFFPEVPHQKLQNLMNKFHQSQVHQQPLLSEEAQELEFLVEAELQATIARASDLIAQIKDNNNNQK